MAAENNKPPAVPAVVKPPLVSGGAVRAIVPTDIESAYRLANAVVNSGIAPKSIDTPEKAMVVIMHGLEIGMTPMMALQSIAPINGFPAIYGDGMLALVEASGLLEDFEETTEWKDGEPVKARCVAKRRGRPTPTISEWTKEMALKANLWSKGGPWTNYKFRMMKFRARAFCLRDAFPDVLKGLRSAEEMEDITPPAGREPKRSDFVSGSSGYDIGADKPAATVAADTITDAVVHDEVRQDDDTPTLYEVFDHTGEQRGEYTVTEWVGAYDGQTPKPTMKKERTQHFQNNQDAARSIYMTSDCPDDVRKALVERFPELAQQGALFGGAK